jgi:hypothetical protein
MASVSMNILSTVQEKQVPCEFKHEMKSSKWRHCIQEDLRVLRLYMVLEVLRVSYSGITSDIIEITVITSHGSLVTMPTHELYVMKFEPIVIENLDCSSSKAECSIFLRTARIPRYVGHEFWKLVCFKDPLYTPRKHFSGL